MLQANTVALAMQKFDVNSPSQLRLHPQFIVGEGPQDLALVLRNIVFFQGVEAARVVRIAASVGGLIVKLVVDDGACVAVAVGVDGRVDLAGLIFRTIFGGLHAVDGRIEHVEGLLILSDRYPYALEQGEVFPRPKADASVGLSRNIAAGGLGWLNAVDAVDGGVNHVQGLLISSDQSLYALERAKVLPRSKADAAVGLS